MTPWLTLAGLRLGLSYRDAMRLPLSELLDLLAADAVRSGRGTLAKNEAEEESDFWACLERK